MGMGAVSITRAIPAGSSGSRAAFLFQLVYAHTLGADPASDPYVLGRGLPKVAEIALENRQNPKYVLASVGNGDGGQFAHFLIGPDGGVKQITQFQDQVVGCRGPGRMTACI